MAWGLMGAPCLSLASHSEDVLSAVLFLCVTFNGGHASLPRAILTQYRSKRTLKPCYAFEPEKKKCWLNYLKRCIGGLAVSFAGQKFM